MLIPPSDFALTPTQKAERNQGYWGLSEEDKQIIEMFLAFRDIQRCAMHFNKDERTIKRMLRGPKARAYQDSLERQMTPRYQALKERVIEELAAIAFSSMDDLMEWCNDRAELIDSSLVSVAARTAVSEISCQYYKGEKLVRVKMHDKQAALALLSKLLFAEPDKMDISIKGGTLDESTAERIVAVLDAARERAAIAPSGSVGSAAQAVETE